MAGTTDLATLLATMDPVLSDSEVVFCSFQHGRLADKVYLQPIGFFSEKEGIALILERSIAEQHAITFDATFRAITLNVHSSLEAIGLTAAVAGRLALHGISANVVAGYYHDHIFVPANHAKRALQVLRDLQAEGAAAIGHSQLSG